MWRSLSVPLVPGVRALTCSSVCQAGSQWRLGGIAYKSREPFSPLASPRIPVPPPANEPVSSSPKPSAWHVQEWDRVWTPDRSPRLVICRTLYNRSNMLFDSNPLPFGFPNGRPAPMMKGHLRRRQKAAEMAGRILMLTNELQRGMERWEEQQTTLCRQREEQQASSLRPKGAKLSPRSQGSTPNQ